MRESFSKYNKNFAIFADMKQEFFNISLFERNSFHIEQRASRLIEFDSPDDLFDIFDSEPNMEWYVLSGGNNILFTKPFEATLLTPTEQSIEIISQDRFSLRVRVAAGVEWDDFVEWCVERELWGAENLSLIPGKVGAAPVQNIGAYGVEVKDIIESVEMFSPSTRNTLTLQAQYCDFGYRDSIFKRSLRGKVIITGVNFRLSKSPAPKLGYGDVVREVAARGDVTLRNIREAICSIRSSKLPDTATLGNAGSFFKNPVVESAVAESLKEKYPDMPLYPIAESTSQVKLAAGWLIDKAQMKGYREGNVGVHEHQALVLVNHGGATGNEIVALSNKICQIVEQKFGVTISPEVNIL